TSLLSCLASDSRRRADNALFNRLAHKNADRFVGQNEPSNRCVQIDDDRASADSLKLAGSDYLSWHTQRLP
ncbi:hypothetical protein EC918_1091, partial [Burkholderia vietnamiensis]|uniref:hypothetical protein n=1 Tax=Burkholderia vietnamiensis TaxID=60552 RepID=UPI0010D203FB